jgi:DNA invertase Pin-like site-specific DNA recombinase
VVAVPIDVVLCYAPDRLARKYAYQALLVEELARAGTTVVFVKGPRSDSPEDALLVQFQGMIAEYERAQIAERTRRGKAHRARQGAINVLSGAPFGYRYIRKSEHAEARYDVVEHEAPVVAELFRRYVEDGAAIADLARWLTEAGVPTRTGKAVWDRSVVWGMLRNPAYAGTAAFAKTMRTGQPAALNRTARLAGRTPRPYTVTDRPRADWVGIPVPPLVSEATFELAGRRLADNKRFASRNAKTPSLLQGLTVCSGCGYAYYRTSTRTTNKTIFYYRCLGSDDYRHAGGRVCYHKPVRADHLDQVVWAHIATMLADPTLVRAEIDRRLDQLRTTDPATASQTRLHHALAKTTAAITRLIEAYQEDLISLDELRNRMPPLRAREASQRGQLDALTAHLVDRDSYLALATNLEGFLTQLHDKATTATVEDRQRVLRLLVKEILIGPEKIVIRHCIPTRNGPRNHPTTDTDTNTDADAEPEPDPSCQLRWRSHHPTLRRASDRPLDTPVHHHTRLQPQPDQPEHPPVRHPPPHQLDQPHMVDLVEEVADVKLRDKGVALDEALANTLHRLRGRPLRAEPIRDRREVGLEDGFQHEFGRLLGHSVADCGDSQRPLTAIWFRDLHPTHRRRAVGTRAKVPGKLVEHPLDPVLLHMCQGDPIHPGRTPVREHPPPRLPQDVTPVDTVIQGVETPLR